MKFLPQWLDDLVRPGDKHLARMAGFSGKNTLSAECGGSDKRVCGLVCWFMNWLEKDHCAKARKAEGL